jgi:hypothetical protein
MKLCVCVRQYAQNGGLPIYRGPQGQNGKNTHTQGGSPQDAKEIKNTSARKEPAFVS